jgi:glycerophosphoryl diester phosphodiesterase
VKRLLLWSVIAATMGCTPTAPSTATPARPTASTATAAPPARLSGRVVDVQGHRGARGLRPENTLAAMRHALALGVTTLEMDCGVTRDGVVVVHHDERLNPDIARRGPDMWVTSPTPVLHALTFAELASYDVGRLRPDSAYATRFAHQASQDGLTIPRLAEVIAASEAQSRGQIRYNIETKLTPGAPKLTPPPDVFADRLVATLRQADVVDRAVVQSFDWRTLRHLRRNAPDITLSCLTDDETVPRNGPSPWTAGLDLRDHGSIPELVAAAGCAVWSPSIRQADEASVRRAQTLGLRVAVWTVNEPTDIEAMLDRGVDALISDYPDRVRQALAARDWPLPKRWPPLHDATTNAEL